MRLKATLSAHGMLVDRTVVAGGALLLVQLAYRDHRKCKWAFPGGYVDYGESVSMALHREVFEEVGVQLVDSRQVDVVSFCQQEKPHVGFLFLSERWKGKPKRCSREILKLIWANETIFWEIVSEDGLAYPEIMKQQVTHLGWMEKGR